MTMRIGYLQSHVLTRSAILALAGLASLAFVTPVLAQGVDAGASDSLGDVSAAGQPDKWRFTLGLGAVAVPDYEGSDEYVARPLPIARAQKGFQYGQLFGLKFSSNLIAHPNFRLGPVVNFRGERDDVENDQVDNMKKVDAALEVGAQVGYDHKLDGGVIGVEVEWVHDVADGHEGWLLTPEVHYRRKLAESWNLSLAASTTYASDDYMESYFGVTPADSARSGLSTFSADEGFKDVNVNLALAYVINEHWGAGVLGGWKRLLDDAEDSPVTKVGDENQFIAGLFFTYSWSAQ